MKTLMLPLAASSLAMVLSGCGNLPPHTDGIEETVAVATTSNLDEETSSTSSVSSDEEPGIVSFTLPTHPTAPPPLPGGCVRNEEVASVHIICPDLGIDVTFTR